MGAIAGCLGLDPETLDLSEIERTMAFRCPGRYEGIKLRAGTLIRNAGPAGGVSLTEGNQSWELSFSGRLDNQKELRQQLQENGWLDPGENLGELVISCFRLWGMDCVQHFRGPFAFALWEKREERLFLARDQMGIEPLFYRREGKRLLFASQLKTLLAMPGVRPELDPEGAAQLILLGPGRKPDSGVFRGMEALEPGCRAVFQEGRLQITRYWHLKDGEHRETLSETAEHIRELVLNAVHRQLTDSTGAFLSGGLDSSILSAVCGKWMEERGEKLHTFSVDYQNNHRFFKGGKFQPTEDVVFIDTMVEAIGSQHHFTVLTAEDLVRELEEATLARDLPGMGDVDFSLMAFCREIRNYVPIALSGECADELFGGYPWYRDPEIRDQEGFPWAQNTWERGQVLRPKSEEPRDYVLALYQNTCRQSDIRPEIGPRERRIKEMMNLNLYWFMQTLLERNDRMRGQLQIRVPFCDWELAQYLYNVPWEMKEYGGREKGLLRYSVRGLLPETVRMRKKSPYPKTYDPQYESLVLARLRCLLTEDAPIWNLVDRETVKRLISEEFPTPWYGQLMKKPQFIAYLLQIDCWLRRYQVNMLF